MWRAWSNLVWPTLAALVIVAAGGACRPADRAAADPTTAVMGTPLRAVLPQGEGPLPERFTWEGSSDDEVVRLTITDRAERKLYSFDARGREARTPAGIETLLPQRETLLWTVSVVGPSDEPVRTSAPQAFTIVP